MIYFKNVSLYRLSNFAGNLRKVRKGLISICHQYKGTVFVTRNLDCAKYGTESGSLFAMWGTSHTLGRCIDSWENTICDNLDFLLYQKRQYLKEAFLDE